jgi:PAS domain S-box-containing protein
MSAPVARLLIVDDEAALTRALCDTLQAEGYSTTGYTSARAALAALEQQSFDVILTDLMMPEMDGISVLAAACEIDPTVVGIVMTGHGSVNTAVKALKEGALDYIIKPFKLNTILPVLTRALTVRRLRMENIQLREALGLHQVSMTIALARDQRAVLERVADAAFEQSGGQSLAIVLSEAGQELAVAAVRGDGSGLPAGQRVPLTAELRDWMARCGESFREPAPAPGLPPGLSLPLLAGGTLIGILHFGEAAAVRGFTSGQLKALEILASAAASALAAASFLAQLRATEQRYRHLTENAPDIVSRFEFLPRRGYVYVNPAVAQVTGYTPAEFYADADLGMTITHPEDRALAASILRGEIPSGQAETLRCITRAGRTVWIEQRTTLVRDADGTLTALETVARDVTARVELEERLRQSQKLEAVGKLTAGVAHDFNNLLTVINGYNALSLQEVGPGAPVFWKLTEIKKAGDQAARLTSQLLAFSRSQMLEPKLVNLAATLDEMDQMIRKVAGELVEVAVRKEAGVGSIRVDPTQLGQVIINLVVNARDAMPRGGRIEIGLSSADLGEDGAREFGIAPGNYVALSVADNGCGMTPEVKCRVFEPFFTTKQAGQGTGLGLATVYGIVQQSGGHIHLESEPGLGTRFTILFERCEPEAEPLRREAEPVAGGSETVLLVEDNEAVRALIDQVLTGAGYRVLAAESGEAALQLVRSHRGVIDLLLSDMGLPGMPGPEVADRLKIRIPHLEVLFMSGSAEGKAQPEAGELLRKPLLPKTLLGKIRKLLDARPKQRVQRVLVVDDDEPIRRLLKEILESAGYEVETACNGKEARERLARQPFELVITDLIMPEVEGIEFIGGMRRELPQLKVIATSGGACNDLLAAAQILGAHATLPKPLTPEGVLQCVRKLT